MGVLDSLLTSSSDDSSTAGTKRKYAILLNAGPENTPAAGNAFSYALELDDGGFEVQLFLDGAATKWPAEFAENPDRPYNADWERIERKGLLAGVCGYCANAFDVAEACRTVGVDLLSDETTHAPSLPELAAAEYEILTVG